MQMHRRHRSRFPAGCLDAFQIQIRGVCLSNRILKASIGTSRVSLSRVFLSDCVRFGGNDAVELESNRNGRGAACILLYNI